MSLKENIINHMEFIGYEFEKMEEDGYFIATHDTYGPTIVKFNERLPLMLEAAWPVTKKNPEKSIKYFTLVNEINKKSAQSVMVGYEKQLRMFSSYIGDYNKKSFGTFLDNWHRDLALIYDHDFKEFVG